MKKVHKTHFGIILLYFLYYILGCLIWTLLLFDKWLFRTFERVTLDEIVYHAKSSIDGTNPDMIWNYIGTSLLPAVGIWTVIYIGLILLRKKAFHKYLILINSLLLCGLIVVVGHDAEERVGLLSYFRQVLSQDRSDFIAVNYTDPREVELKFPEHRRNLIYIYLESMETTYADQKNGGGFEDNYIKELTLLAKENECFAGDSEKINGGICLPGTTWTMGAMFGQSSGLPLKVSVNGNQMSTQDSFFSGMVSLGDILEQHGYQQELLIGSSAVFGGRELYYKEHGNYDIHDYDYAAVNQWIPEGYAVFWGYEDQKLFEFAKNDLLRLADEGVPFNLTMLTADTHFEDGYVCELCGNEFGDNQYANVMACSSRQVMELVRWVQKQDFYEDTTIVISGDHITMDSDFCAGVDPDYQRRTYTVIINGAATAENESELRNYSTLDLFPTTLAAMGVDIKGDCLGLGVNLYSDERTIIEKYGLDWCVQELDKPSDFLEQFAGIVISEDIMNTIASVTNTMVSESADHTIVYSIGWGTIDQSIDASAIKEMRVVVDNTEDGSSYSYDMEVSTLESDQYLFTCEAVTDIPFEDLPKMTAKVYISVGEYEGYLIDVVGGEE